MEDVFESIPSNKFISFSSGSHVRLVDSLPRMVPIGRGCDFAIVRNARVSTGNGLKTIEQDKALINRLYKDNHTSPFESVSFVFEIKCQLFTATHLIRHRTAKINMFSQRYASVDKVDKSVEKLWYTPDARRQSKSNHQGSEDSKESNEHLDELILKADEHIKELFSLYNEMLNYGMAREVARYCLPESTFTSLYFEIDLNNLLKFFKLRCAPDTQQETREISCAMRDLIRPLLPMMAEFL